MCREFQVKHCSITGCDRGFYAKNYCRLHYIRNRNNGHPLKVQSRKKDRRCTAKDCDRKHMALGYCAKHYARFCKHGDVNHVRSENVKICLVKTCDAKYYALGYCEKHYKQL